MSALFKDHFGYRAHAQAIQRARIALEKQVYGFSMIERKEQIDQVNAAISVAYHLAALFESMVSGKPMPSKVGTWVAFGDTTRPESHPKP